MFDVSGGVADVLGFDIRKTLITIIILIILGLGGYVAYALYFGSKNRTLQKFETGIAISIGAIIIFFVILVILL